MTIESRWTFNASAGESSLDKRVLLREIAIAQGAGQPLTEICIDLLEVAAAVQAVDRMAKRPSPNRCGNSWGRTLHLRVGVRLPDLWSQPEVVTAIEDLLAWLTDDDWTIDFDERCPGDRPSEQICYLFGPDLRADYVALFSGGLDSVMGVGIDLAEGRSPMLVSAESNSRMIASQRETHDLLEAGFGRAVPRIRVGLNLHQEAPESSQRSRGFGFMSMAAATAHSLGLDTVRVYENGVGAINLPYLASQMGAHGTRSMHPLTLEKASSLFSLVLRSPIRFENPYRVETKAEMCMRAPSEAHAAMAASRSCDGAFTIRKTQPWNCGRCTSCLLRRQSLIAGGLADLDAQASYAHDFLSETTTGQSPADRPLETMLTQVSRLQEVMRCLSPERALVEEFPEVSLVAPAGIGGRLATRVELLRMYSTYVDEWSSIPTPSAGRFLEPATSAADPAGR